MNLYRFEDESSAPVLFVVAEDGGQAVQIAEGLGVSYGLAKVLGAEGADAKRRKLSQLVIAPSPKDPSEVEKRIKAAELERADMEAALTREAMKADCLKRDLGDLAMEKDAIIAAEVKRAQKAERERDKLSDELCDEVKRKCELKERLKELKTMVRGFAKLEMRSLFAGADNVVRGYISGESVDLLSKKIDQIGETATS